MHCRDLGEEGVDTGHDWQGSAELGGLDRRHWGMDGMGRMNRCLMVVEAARTDVAGAACDLACKGRKVCRTVQVVADRGTQVGQDYHLGVAAGTGCCCMGGTDSSYSVRRVKRCDDRRM